MAFDEQETALAEYDPDINETTAVWQQKKLEAVWTSKLEKQARIVGTKHGLRQFLLHAFRETYYIQLRDEHTFYEMVSPLQLLAHIANAISGLKVTNVVAVLGDIFTYSSADPRVPQ